MRKVPLRNSTARRVRVFAACALLAATCAWAQHEKEEGKAKHPFIGNAQAIAAGQKLFADGCAACHGAEGNGGRGPNLRQRVLWHPVDEDTIFKAVKNGIGGGMPATNMPDDQIWQIVAFVKSLTAPAIENNVPGDRDAGEALFFGKAGCSGCHRIHGKGGSRGPDLTNAGATLAVPAIREAILDPDADGAWGWRAATLTLNSGRVLQGLARNRSNYSIQLQDVEGNLHLVNVADVKEMTIAKGSSMPKDFARRLDRMEIVNLIAFLSRQSSRRAATTAKN